MELIISIFFIVLITVIIATQWVKGIDYMDKHHPNYKGEDLFEEERKEALIRTMEEDKEKQRELIKEIIQADEKDGLYDDWDITLMDGLEDEPAIISEEDAKSFFDSLESETEPNEYLKEAVKKYKKSKK